MAENSICLWYDGDVLTVEFTVMGIRCVGLNGGAARVKGPTSVTQPR